MAPVAGPGSAGQRAPGGWHPESGLPREAQAPQTSGVTDTSTRSVRPDTRWERHSSTQTLAELLLGLSFITAVAAGGYSAATGQLTVLSQGAGIVFLVTLTCVLVSWFRSVEREDTPDDRTVAQAARSTAATTAQDSIAAIDAEYRR